MEPDEESQVKDKEKTKPNCEQSTTVSNTTVSPPAPVTTEPTSLPLSPTLETERTVELSCNSLASLALSSTKSVASDCPIQTASISNQVCREEKGSTNKSDTALSSDPLSLEPVVALSTTLPSSNDESTSPVIDCKIFTDSIPQTTSSLSTPCTVITSETSISISSSTYETIKDAVAFTPSSITEVCSTSASITASDSTVTSSPPDSPITNFPPSDLCAIPASTSLVSQDTPVRMAETSVVDCVQNGDLKETSPTSNPMEELDDEQDIESTKPLVAPSNTPITGDSGHNSPVMERSNTGSGDEGQKEKVEVKSAEKEKIETKPKSVPAPASSNPVKESPRNGNRESKRDKTTSSKNKKKEDKGIESILRALNSLQTPEEKLAALCKRYADMNEEHRVLQTSLKTQERSLTVMKREKDQVQSDHAKAVIAKSKLESLCRELQKQNKLIKDESIQRAKEDDEKRREISAKFQTTIGEIQTQMNNNNERNSKLQNENLELAGQLKKFVEQYENREQKMKQHRDLEQQVAEARLAQTRALLKEEQEKNGKEKELLLMKAAESGKKVHLLEAQVGMFKERYDEFESLHARSNETFQKYKTEMDKMTKRIKRLEKDGLAWKSKWERTNKSLVEAVDARANAEKETTVYVQKTKKLESLCRALQAELHKDKKSPPPPKTPSPVDEVPPNSQEIPSGSDQKNANATHSDEPINSSSPNSENVTGQEVSNRGEADGQSTAQSPDSTTPNLQNTSTNEADSSPSNEQNGATESEKSSSSPSPDQLSQQSSNVVQACES